MTEIQGGRWDNLLRRLFPVKGGSIAPALAPEIQPHVSVQDFLPEMHYLVGEKLGMGWMARAASAGNYGVIQLVNPDDSGVLAIIEEMQASRYVAAGLIYVKWDNTGTASGGGKAVNARDARWNGGVCDAPSTEECTCGVYGADVAASPGSVIWEHYGATVEHYFLSCTPLVIPPGNRVTITTSAQNTAIRGGYIWRERPFLTSER